MEGGSFRYSLSSFGVNAMNRIPAVTAKTMSEIGSARIRRQAIQRKKQEEKDTKKTRRAISYQRMSHPNIYAKE